MVDKVISTIKMSSEVDWEFENVLFELTDYYMKHGFGVNNIANVIASITYVLA